MVTVCWRIWSNEVRNIEPKNILAGRTPGLYHISSQENKKTTTFDDRDSSVVLLAGWYSNSDVLLKLLSANEYDFETMRKLIIN
jgi:hypothetical protein